HYGVEHNRNRAKNEWLRLSHLVRSIAELPGDFRVRLSSIEATEVTRELIDCVAEHSERIAPHFHICLQSGSDAVLRRMRRRWSSRMFIDRCRLVRERLDNPAITTDIIVGFPGESDADFETTCRVSRDCGFSKIHIFPFSPRKGTPAAEMANKIAPEVKAARCERLAELERELRRDYFQSLIGQRLTVLVEGPLDRSVGTFGGTSCRYAPVEMLGDESQVGNLVDVQPLRLRDDLVLRTEY
ncbi:MAG: radical SAM protein, partial [Planctomycetia bacterium]|nr:radical SAM protein [Planctomycetia bacterium]